MALSRGCLLFVAAVVPALCLASIDARSVQVKGVQDSLSTRERQVWSSPVHDSEFASVQHTTARGTCEATRPPEALTTPNPVLDKPDPSSKVTVSFIIGTDGRVHSPLVLESAGTAEDRTVLETVRFWRYRPAMCNGVPTEAEGRIEFSSR